jgi:hypothetical protein
MGSIFNTPGTQMLIGVLSTTFTQNFTATAANATLIHDLDPTTGMASFGFCGKHHLVATGPGAGSINSHWATWLAHFDSHGGNSVRTAMANALRNTAKYEAIEFFAVPDTSFSLTASDHDNGHGKFSLMVLARTPTWDRL